MKKALKVVGIILLIAILAVPAAVLAGRIFGGGLVFAFNVLWYIGPVLAGIVILFLLGRWLFRKIKG